MNIEQHNHQVNRQIEDLERSKGNMEKVMERLARLESVGPWCVAYDQLDGIKRQISFLESARI